MNLPALILAFTMWPVLELLLLMKVHEMIELGPTLAIVIMSGVVGASLARFQGVMIVGDIHRDLSDGRMPAPRLIDGVMVLVAGALLITPGLISDAVGFLLLVPAVRSVLKAHIRRKLESRFTQGKTIEVHDVEW